MIKNQNNSANSEPSLPEDLLVGMASIYKIYRSLEIETVAVRGVTLSLFEKEIVGVIGPSGSGKTTLVNIMAGLIKPTAGIIFWAPVGADITRLPDDLITRTRNQFIGVLSQRSDANIIPHLSVIENVMLQGSISNFPREMLKKRALELLDRVGLKQRRNSNPMSLSTGEKQRIGLAAALINHPKIILADEPTGSLDYNTGEALLHLITEINENLGIAFLIVTHSQQVVPFTHRVIEIRDGIIAGQHEGMEFEDLSQSRVTIADEQGRIFLPEELLKKLPIKTNQFRMAIHEGKIIIEPISTELTKKKNLFQRQSVKELSCPVCQTLNIGKNILCTNCGSLLRKAGRLSGVD